jgi:D-glycero-alpha-D-manno-heptose-7-phosphate kinase
VIVTRTPFRLTLGGGGTDLPSFYERHGGFVFAMGIDKYMYIMLNPPTLDHRIRLHHSRMEEVDDVDDLAHELAREAFRMHGIRSGMEVSSMADLPAGTGLGSSSAYLVGLLTALHQHGGRRPDARHVAEEACHIELEVLGKPIGKQDQYMAAYGGLTVLEIERNGSVQVRRVRPPAASLSRFIAGTHLYYTGCQRSATDMLQDQDSAMRAGPAGGSEVADSLLRIKDLGHRILNAVEHEDYDQWGLLLHEHWRSKRRLSKKVSLEAVDRLYEHVRREYGVLGGKIAGAGGGGFLMLYCPARHHDLEQFMLAQGMPRLHYTLEREGAKVLAHVAAEPELRVSSRPHRAAMQVQS